MRLTLSHTTLKVDDHEKALVFYRDVLGFTVRGDVEFEGMRWVTVSPPTQPEVEIVLEPPSVDPNASPADRQAIAELMAKGMMGRLVFATDDCDATFERIQAAGAEVLQEPIDQPYGMRDCGFRDPAGNVLRFAQSRNRPPPPARDAEQRRRDTLDRLEHDVDAWIATAGGTGPPYLVPLSFLWDGATVLFSTPATSPTGRNLRANGRVRIGFGPTRDVVLLDGVLEEVTPAADVPPAIGDAFAAKAGFDPRESPGYLYFRVRPQRLQAWREANELTGRDLMRDGEWLAPDQPRQSEA
ncbi:MAG: VOC family protein [Mycobacteriales bacterium]